MEKTEKRQLIKLAASTAVAIGADVIIAGVAATVTPNVGRIAKLCVFAAEVVIGGVVGEYLAGKTDTIVEDMLAMFDTAKAAYNEATSTNTEAIVE